VLTLFVAADQQVPKFALSSSKKERGWNRVKVSLFCSREKRTEVGQNFIAIGS